MRLAALALLAVLLGAACGADTMNESTGAPTSRESAAAPGAEPPGLTSALPPLESADANDAVGEAQEAISARRAVCIGAITLGVNLGCVAAGAACSGTTYLTVGGTAYPCLLVVAAACAALPTGGLLYIESVCPRQ